MPLPIDIAADLRAVERLLQFKPAHPVAVPPERLARLAEFIREQGEKIDQLESTISTINHNIEPTKWAGPGV